EDKRSPQEYSSERFNIVMEVAKLPNIALDFDDGFGGAMSCEYNNIFPALNEIARRMKLKLSIIFRENIEKEIERRGISGNDVEDLKRELESVYITAINNFVQIARGIFISGLPNALKAAIEDHLMESLVLTESNWFSKGVKSENGYTLTLTTDKKPMLD